MTASDSCERCGAKLSLSMPDVPGASVVWVCACGTARVLKNEEPRLRLASEKP